MPHRFIGSFALLCLLVFGVVAAPIAADNAADARIQEAKALFQKFTRLSGQFDPAVAELYADDAQVVAHRRYPTGRTRPIQIAGRQLKAMIRHVMPVARMRNDRNTYADVDYAAEGTAVRINSTRYSVLKQYSRPHTLLVRPDADGNWRIYEETMHTRP
ncbi:MAG: hypothetical protein MJE12_14585 [Alphaproteobacteria bacterium]|nr:hypothetical protein [Alphaproteobacteria bacterium]